MTTSHTQPADQNVLLLRLAGPLQSWGIAGENNRRDTASAPTKSGILGLLAAAEGRRREDPITDLLSLHMGVRTDQPGSLLRDYHTVSDYRGVPLLSAAVTTAGVQKPTSPKKPTHVTTRFYLQDAVFLAAIAGPAATIETLHRAVTNPAFPLALGRRSCVPAGRLVIGVQAGGLMHTLQTTPWQAGDLARARYRHSNIDLPITIDAEAATVDGTGTTRHTVFDVPISFHPRKRGFRERDVIHTWTTVPTGHALTDETSSSAHDPFALIGW
ncbi:type I-E CRISPR-associated protein Cas5/CasD [Catenulispora sp. NL8]|uniref:Type I-E CRISPR-associated protein Cas5/CasD n=1 Tax=Catenulispora pinistramenti TaxID=2705254 RepID=A0ABS5KJV3_9ACTN|nr:type I-E CRISPR-associated protein Cas5/CasD [Catenulispora pinistramenti]MBS2545346.1 type I-E CRISPR-associated protein Cas5/CasD [Catenulispora pinistramenti]